MILKKTAQRLLIELKDKLNDIEILATDEPISEKSPQSNNNLMITETKSALISLGYKEKEAEQAIKLVQKQDSIHENTQSLLKASLQQLAKGN